MTLRAAVAVVANERIPTVTGDPTVRSVRRWKREQPAQFLELVRTVESGGPLRHAGPTLAALRLKHDDEERALIEATLSACAGIQSVAAERLGVSLRGLDYRMQALGIERYRTRIARLRSAS